MRKAILAMVFSAIWCSTTLAGNLDMGKLAGMWEVDYDRTMAEGKKSPKYDDKMAERLPAMVKRMMGRMRITLTDKEMIYVMGAKEMALPYTVKSSDANSVTVSAKQGTKEVTVVFTLIEATYMNFKSSGSDDMDYYVWKRATKTGVE